MTPDPWTDVAVPLLAGQDRLLTATQLRRRGVGPQTVRAWVATGRLVRLRRNVLVEGETWRSTPSWGRHLVRARGAMLDRGGIGAALSHHSALAVMGLAIHGTDALVHLVGVGVGGSRRSAGLVRHAAIPEDRITDAFGVPTVTPAVACTQVAAAFGVEAGLVAADSALRAGVCRREDLAELRGWPALGRGRPAAGVVIDRADGRHESAGESRTSWLLHRLGLDPTPQVRITDASGNVVARVDFLFERERVVVEFDGMLKYAGHSDLTAEKVREDRLRAMGYEVVRLTWADLDRPDAVRARLEAAFELARRRAR